MLNLAAIGRERVVERAWSERDVIFYALAVGAGQDDCGSELELTTENSAEVDLRVLPTFATLLQVQPTLLLSDRQVATAASSSSAGFALFINPA